MPSTGWTLVYESLPKSGTTVWGYDHKTEDVEIVHYDGTAERWERITGGTDINIVAWAEMTYPDVTEVHNLIDRGVV